MRKSLYLLLLCGSYLIGYGGDVRMKAAGGPGSSGRSFLKPDTAFVSFTVARVFDLDFRDHQFSVDLLLYISVDSAEKCDFEKELKVFDAKDCKPRIIKTVVNGRMISTRLSLKAVIFKEFAVQNYPFDGQHIQIKLYDAAFNVGKLVFKIDEKITLPGRSEKKLEDGWFIHKIGDSAIICDREISRDEGNMFSSVALDLDMHRAYTASLFLKLFTGMYIAFFIAFASLFIEVKATESRFALLVGGLFGAIGNKYVTESQLPQSPQFCMADWLHTMSIFFIFLIVVSSLISLRLRAARFNWPRPVVRVWSFLDSITPAAILGAYFLVNFLCIHWAVMHEVLLDQ